MKECTLTIKQHHILYLEKGNKILQCIQEFCQRHAIASASYTAIGAVLNIELAYFNTEQKKYEYKSFKDDYELASLMGNCAFIKNNNEKDGYFAHTHVTISNNTMQTFGGHLVEAEVAAVVEVFLTEYKEPLYRSFSETIGLNLIDL